MSSSTRGTASRSLGHRARWPSTSDVVSIPSGTITAFPRDSFFVARHALEGYFSRSVIPRQRRRAPPLSLFLHPQARRGRGGARRAADLPPPARRAEIKRRPPRDHAARPRARAARPAVPPRSRSPTRSAAGSAADLHDSTQQRMIVPVAARIRARAAQARAGSRAGGGAPAPRRRGGRAPRRRAARARARPAPRRPHGVRPRTRFGAGGPQPERHSRSSRCPTGGCPRPSRSRIYYLVREALSRRGQVRGGEHRAGRGRAQGAARVHRRGLRRRRGPSEPAAGSGLAGLDWYRGSSAARSTCSARRARGRGCGPAVPLAPWRTAREPVPRLGHADDSSAGAELIARGALRRDRVDLARAPSGSSSRVRPKIGQRLPVMDHKGPPPQHGPGGPGRRLPFGEVDAGSVEDTSRVSAPTTWRTAQRDTLRPLPRAGALRCWRAPAWRLDGRPSRWCCS